MKELWQLPPALEPAAMRLAGQWGAAPPAAAGYSDKQAEVRRAPPTRREGMNLKKLMCRIWGHDRMQTAMRQRVCLRCGQRETLRQFGSTTGWEELPDTAR